jgi:hypothetical protein
VDVIEQFESQSFSIDDEKNDNISSFIFTIKITSELPGFWIENLAFFLKHETAATAWKRIVLLPTSGVATGSQFAIIHNEDVQAFSSHFSKTRDRSLFLSMTFGQPRKNEFSRYDFTTPWCWEFQVDTGSPAPGYKTYVITRDKERAEKPNFGWRKQNTSLKYQDPKEKG